MSVKHLVWLVLTVAWPVFAQTVATNHYDTLKQSACFALAGGIANMTTPQGHAVAALCTETNTAAFQRLLQEPGAAQQLYGLLGLHLLNAPEYKTALPPFLKSQAKVKTLTGCMAGEREVAEVARQIEAKQWKLRTMPVPGGKYAPTIVER